ncbi:hypothetical protein [Arthrobacter sp. zg-Y1110]|uniref:hypothetical protein n=1 Tax=Arthrobacter sp. zg-Y1110 TaxID=2886932 RepID=UPI001D150D37|nr:hypothetical protein [Arthrobacter sp. zg-Y1110]MCC3292884.1 hypothetical protein [Arthrobacter sp. zg-Y1110]UWX86822.1 hypothetical protein N2K99_18440 [Arthrobacter sp. zg-Y1110]
MSTDNSILMYGASDDVVVLEGAIDDEFGCYDKLWQARLTAPDGTSMQVSAHYGRDGWALASGPVDGNTGKTWPVAAGKSPDDKENPSLRIDAPAGTTIEVFGDCAEGGE